MKAGDLFVAFRGDKFDGLNYVAEAVDRGCAGVLCDRAIEDYRIPHRLSFQRPGGLRFALPAIGGQSQPADEGHRRHRHQRQNDDRLPHRPECFPMPGINPD